MEETITKFYLLCNCKAVIFPSKVNFKKKFLRKYETKGYVFTTQCGKMEGSEDGEGGGVE